MLNKTLFILGAALALGGPAAVIARNELVLARGRTVLLELVPVDPRSLMQGDYMDLRFAVGSEAVIDGRGGLMVLRDEDGIARLLRMDQGGPLGPGEYRLRFRVGGSNRVQIAGNAFFFQEGHGAEFARARYGELRVGAGGEAILTALRGPNRELLGRALR